MQKTGPYILGKINIWSQLCPNFLLFSLVHHSLVTQKITQLLTRWDSFMGSIGITWDLLAGLISIFQLGERNGKEVRNHCIPSQWVRVIKTWWKMWRRKHAVATLPAPTKDQAGEGLVNWGELILALPFKCRTCVLPLCNVGPFFLEKTLWNMAKNFWSQGNTGIQTFQEYLFHQPFTLSPVPLWLFHSENQRPNTF